MSETGPRVSLPTRVYNRLWWSRLRLRNENKTQGRPRDAPAWLKPEPCSTAVYKPVSPVNPQIGSPFFTRFPPEIRDLIYGAYLDDVGAAQHVFQRDDCTFAFCGCVTEHEAPVDEGPREALDALWEAKGRPTTTVQNPLAYLGPLPEGEAWPRHMRSLWGNHWRCEEAMLQGGLLASPTLGPLLTCKRMYDEFSHILHQNLTYVFTDFLTMRDAFLTSRPSLLWHVSNIQVSFFRATDMEEHMVHFAIDPFNLVCERIDRLEHLKSLSIWFATPYPSPCYNAWWSERQWYAWIGTLRRHAKKITVSLPANDNDYMVILGREPGGVVYGCEPNGEKSNFIARGRCNYRRGFGADSVNVYFSSHGFLDYFRPDMGWHPQAYAPAFNPQRRAPY